MATNPLTNTAYVANVNDNTVSVISGKAETVTATIPVGSFPHDVADNPVTNTIYVTNSGGDYAVGDQRENRYGDRDHPGRHRAGRRGHQPGDQHRLRRQFRKQHRIGDQRENRYGDRDHPGRADPAGWAPTR